MPKCPRCGSRETEKLGVRDVIDSGSEGELVSQRAQCLRCGHVFSFDEFVPRPEKETV